MKCKLTLIDDFYSEINKNGTCCVDDDDDDDKGF